jgi:hypothetical protein
MKIAVELPLLLPSRLILSLTKLYWTGPGSDIIRAHKRIT